MKKKSKLPNRLSDLILVALKDLRKCEKNPKYTVEMSKWHRPSCASAITHLDWTCEVCLAGSVIAQTLKTPIIKLKEPVDFGEVDEHKLYALDYIRGGDVLLALRHFYEKKGKGLTRPVAKKINLYIEKYRYAHYVPAYINPKDDPTDSFKEAINNIAVQLKEFDL